jgi:protoporphyrinogen oxidase
MAKKQAVIIGAGPGGLTAAYELLTRTDVLPIIFEESDYIGGIARTVVYKGNRIDIGGHRFFSKSDRVMDWWTNILPLEKGKEKELARISYHGATRGLTAQKTVDPAETDRVMLVRSRKSRIFYNGHFFDYPVTLSFDTIRKFGFFTTFLIGLSYLKSAIFPYKKPKNLEEFYINQFGKHLYEIFFRSYTEKVWGTPCKEISAEWGSQRVKGLSLVKALSHFVKKLLVPQSMRKKTETSLIESFLYPKFGPGHLWEEVAKDVVKMGGELHMRHDVVDLEVVGDKVVSVTVLNKATGETRVVPADYVFSTMPVKDLVARLKAPIPAEVRHTGERLEYRDFITVGLLAKKMAVSEADGGLIKDNWIYVQEPWAKVGRVQIFNNWSPYLVADPATVWLGLEYFCNEGDELWNMEEAALIALAGEEMEKMGLLMKADILDAVVIRMKKTYPGYFGEYKHFDRVRAYTDTLKNLFLIGRNGMHKYNNQDHSMLTAMVAVDNIKAGREDKANIWAVNTEEDYHEGSTRK